MSVPESVRRCADIKPGEFPITGHQLLDGPDRQRTVTPVLEERRRRSRGEAARGVERYHLADAGLGHPVERDHTTPGTFADRRRQVEILAGLTIESDQVHDQASAFTDPKASVKEEQDQQVITAPEGRIKIDHFEDLQGEAVTAPVGFRIWRVRTLGELLTGIDGDPRSTEEEPSQGSGEAARPSPTRKRSVPAPGPKRGLP
jgi:hypothetical protein